MVKESILCIFILASCLLLGCQRTQIAHNPEDLIIRRDSHIYVNHGLKGCNVQKIVTSALDVFGILKYEIKVDHGKYEYHANFDSGEKIVIKAFSSYDCGVSIDMEVWGEKMAAEVIRNELTKLMNADLHSIMCAYN